MLGFPCNLSHYPNHQASSDFIISDSLPNFLIFLDHLLESQVQRDLTGHFAGFSMILLFNAPSSLISLYLFQMSTFLLLPSADN